MSVTTNFTVAGGGISGSTADAVQALVSGAGIAWASLPAASTVPGMITPVNDLSNALFRSDGTSWSLVSPSILKFSKTRVVGVSSASAQPLINGTTISLPRSLLASLRFFQLAFTATKDGTTDAATTIIAYLGPTGDNSDSSFFSTAGLSAINRALPTGTVLQYDASDQKCKQYLGTQGTTIGVSTATTTAFPDTSRTTAALADVVHKLSIYVTMAGTTNIPALENYVLIGY